MNESIVMYEWMKVLECMNEWKYWNEIHMQDTYLQEASQQFSDIHIRTDGECEEPSPRESGQQLHQASFPDAWLPNLKQVTSQKYYL